jgi:hypothetical protein
MKLLTLIALVAALVGCGGVESAPRCEAGRVQSCPCAGGATGTQECGPSGAAWSACVCSSADSGADVAVADGAADAGDASKLSDAAVGDASLVDGAPAPRLYRACDIGGDCGAGLMCVAVPGVVIDAGARGTCTTTCATSAECAGGALCVMGVCEVECPTGEDRECTALGTACRVSRARTPDSRTPAGIPATAFCAP